MNGRWRRTRVRAGVAAAALLSAAVLVGVASAAPAATQPITFDLDGGYGKHWATMVVTGDMVANPGSPEFGVTGLRGDLTIGGSPFANTTKHVTVRSLTANAWFPDPEPFAACLAMETPVDMKVAGWLGPDRFPEVHHMLEVKSAGLRGTGDLWYADYDVCVVRMPEEGGEPFLELTREAFAHLEVVLVGRGVAGRLVLDGPFPRIGP